MCGLFFSVVRMILKTGLCIFTYLGSVVDVRKVAEKNLLPVHPYLCAPPSFSFVPRNTSYARGVSLTLREVAIAQSTGDNPQVCQRVVQPIMVNMVNEHIFGDHPMRDHPRNAVCVEQTAIAPYADVEIRPSGCRECTGSPVSMDNFPSQQTGLWVVVERPAQQAWCNCHKLCELAFYTLIVPYTPPVPLPRGGTIRRSP